MSADADMRTLEGSDAPARVYVAFSFGFGNWATRLINYVWASSMKPGTQVPSVFSPSSRILVLEGGSEKTGVWVSEERNVFEDYRRLYGEEPGEVVGIALMTDSDNTRSEAIADYDDIAVSRTPSPEPFRNIE
jgi:hypothetical protein